MEALKGNKELLVAKAKLKETETGDLTLRMINILELVKSHAGRIEIKSKAIEELELKDSVMKEAIITVANNDKTLEDKLTFFTKFLSRNTYSCFPIKEMNKETFIYLREYLKKNSGIKPIPREERLSKK